MAMTEEQRTALHAARAHLTDRFQSMAHAAAGVWPRQLRPQPLSHMVAVSTLAEAIEAELEVEGEFGVDTDDLRAGLRLLPHARQHLDASEFDILHRAQQEMTWDEIGALTGIGDRRLAHQRYTRLRKRLGLEANGQLAGTDESKPVQ